MELSLKDHLEASTEASRRVRATTIVLVVVTVLILAGFLNTAYNHAWTRSRIKFRQEYGLQLNQKLDELKRIANPSKDADSLTPAASEPTSQEKPVLEISPVVCGNIYCESIFVDCGEDAECMADQAKASSRKNTPDDRSASQKLAKKCAEDQKCRKKKLACYECSKEFSGNLLKELERSYVDNVYLIRVPFFGVALDVNDLGFLGGLGLLIVLIMLRLSLRNYIVSLRISIKRCFSRGDVTPEDREDFYEILTARQLFVFPHFRDEEQEYFTGATEASWNVSYLKMGYIILIKVITKILAPISFILRLLFHRLILVPSKQNGNRKKASLGRENESGYYVNPQLSLKIVPKVISIVPGVVYLLVVINDYLSWNSGRAVDEMRANLEFILSIIFLILIWSFGCWCISKWFEVDSLWEEFYIKVFKKNAIERSSPG